MESKTYKIGKVKQLIDLNGESVNFNIDFSIKSENNEPFEMLVIPQSELDNLQNIEYKKVENGNINGNIRQDQNVYENYSLILKADKDINCQVSINKQELESFINSPLPEVYSPSKTPKNNSETSYVKYILITLVIGVGLYFLYSFWKKSKNNQPTVNFTKKPIFINRSKSFSRSSSRDSLNSLENLPQIELPKPKPQIELPKPKPQIELPKLQPQIELPKPQPQIELPKPQPQIELPKHSNNILDRLKKLKV